MSFLRDFKNRIIKLCRNKGARKLILPLVKLTGKKTYVERIMKMEAEERYFAAVNNNRTVLRGPFKGMKYASFNSYGSELAPKILGSYEMELNEIIEEVIKDPSITEVIDIGSAEGYYAVGMALRKPTAQIYAYDIKAEAIELSKSMAKENNIDKNITYRNFCSNETLKNFTFKNRAFIISDCEGYEMNLFDQANISNLTKCDVLIEMHDFINPKISPYLKDLFSKTHKVKIVKSKQRDPKEFSELSSFSQTEQKLILSECRIGILDEQPMEWLYAKAIIS